MNGTAMEDDLPDRWSIDWAAWRIDLSSASFNLDEVDLFDDDDDAAFSFLCVCVLCSDCFGRFFNQSDESIARVCWNKACAFARVRFVKYESFFTSSTDSCLFILTNVTIDGLAWSNSKACGKTNGAQTEIWISWGWLGHWYQLSSERSIDADAI